jgi:hypothetical protein
MRSPFVVNQFEGGDAEIFADVNLRRFIRWRQNYELTERSLREMPHTFARKGRIRQKIVTVRAISQVAALGPTAIHVVFLPRFKVRFGAGK